MTRSVIWAHPSEVEIRPEAVYLAWDRRPNALGIRCELVSGSRIKMQLEWRCGAPEWIAAIDAPPGEEIFCNDESGLD